MQSMMQLSGPSQKPASGGPAKQLVVLLHGLGADGNDLIGLAPVLSQVLPEAAFVSPNAPFPCDMAPFGYQWFSVQDRTPSVMLAGVRMAASMLAPFLDEQLAAHNLTPDKLALIGFSQGTMMSLHVGLRRPQPVAGILGYSGRLIAPELLAEELKSRPPVQLVHGDSDEMVPFESMQLAAEGLQAAGVDVQTHMCRGLGHGIDQDGLIVGAQFLRRIFPPA